MNRLELARKHSDYAFEKFDRYGINSDHWILKLLKDDILPTREDIDEMYKIHYELFSDQSYALFYVRDVYNQIFSFPVITQEVLEEMIEYFRGKRILEVAAGSGYISSLLQNEGIDIKPTDTFDWANGKGFYTAWKEMFTEVEKLDGLKAIDKYGDEYKVVLLSWPMYDNPFGYNVLRKCLEKDLTLVYIGEDETGCTANDDFFTLRDKCATKCIIHSYRPFPTIYDHFYEIKKN